MKFQFPFVNVLNYRKTVENLAQRDFQEAYGKLLNEQQILDQLLNKKSEAREAAFQAQVQGGGAASSLVQVSEFLSGQDVRIARQQELIQKAEKKVEEFREILRQKAIDYKIIDELRERKYQEWLIERRKIEQKQTDENNTMRFRRAEETEEKKKN